MTLHYAKMDLSENFVSIYNCILAELPNMHTKGMVISEIYTQFSNKVRDYILNYYNIADRTEVIGKMAVVESRTDNSFINGLKSKINNEFYQIISNIFVSVVTRII